MDMTLIATALNGIKFAKESFSALLDLKIEIEAQDRVHAALKQLGEVYESLFTLREQLFDLQSKNQELQQALSDQTQWAMKVEQYEIVETNGGAIVYIFKSEPKHYVCPNCTNRKEIQILQNTRTVSGNYECPSCKSKFPIAPRTPLPPAVLF